MDDLDRALLDAWHRVRTQLAADPARAGRRVERALRQSVRRPVRGWCLCVRASSPRWSDPGLAQTKEDRQRCAQQQAHRVVITGAELRAACRPVSIGPPGVTVAEAAQLLGRDETTTWRLVRKGVLRPASPKRLGKTDHKRGGGRKLLVVTDGPIDPARDYRRGPDELRDWGSLWQHHHTKVDQGFEQVVQRVPRLWPAGRSGGRKAGAKDEFRGWEWVCPGRELADGRVVPCGRVCRRLFGPLPVWTVGRMLGDEALGMVVQGAVSNPALAMPDPEAQAGVRRLACGQCWGVQSERRGGTDTAAWNLLVTTLSGGWLYGREVERT